MVARYFGPYFFGEFTKITSLVTLFYLFVDFGLNAVFIKEDKDFSNLFYTRLFISFFVFALANIIAFLFPYNQVSDIGFSPFVRWGIFIFSFSLFAQSITFSTAAFFQKNLRWDLFMISQVIGAVFNIFITSLLIFFAKSLNLVIVSFAVSSFLTAVISLILANQKISKFELKYCRKLFLSSIPLGLMLIFNLIYFRIDIFLLSLFKSNVDVGVYSLAYKFFDFFIAIPLFLSNSLYPKMLESLKSRGAFSKLIKNYFFVYLLLAILIIIPVWFTTPLFGLIRSNFTPAYLPFRILILSLPVFFLTSFVQWILIAMNKQKFLVYVYLLSVIINIFLNMLLIPKYSYIASSILTGLSEIFVLALLVLKLKQTRIFSEKPR